MTPIGLLLRRNHVGKMLRRCRRRTAWAGLGVVLSALVASGANCGTPVPGGAPVLVDSDHVLGSPDAPVTVFEYANLRCSHCRDFATTQFSTVRQRYIDTGQVRWIYRHLILMSDEDLVRAACASECAADQGKYTEYLDLLYQNPDQFSADSLKQFASDLNLDRSAFDACLDSGSQVARVQQDVDSALALGLNATPQFFVNGESVLGYQTADALGAVIDRHLSDSGGP